VDASFKRRGEQLDAECMARRQVKPTYYFKGRLPMRTRVKCLLASGAVLGLALFAVVATEDGSPGLTIVRALVLIPATGLVGGGAMYLVILRDLRRLRRRAAKRQRSGDPR
jgi:hypothetical protein